MAFIYRTFMPFLCLMHFHVIKSWKCLLSSILFGLVVEIPTFTEFCVEHDKHTLSISCSLLHYPVPEFSFPFACSAKGITHTKCSKRVLNTWNLEGIKNQPNISSVFVLVHPSLFTKCVEGMNFSVCCFLFFHSHHQYEVNIHQFGSITHHNVLCVRWIRTKPFGFFNRAHSTHTNTQTNSSIHSHAHA